jgi:mannose-1-phosphate guanylyltransferase/mannose-6-phosphate isomerase
MAGGTGSRLWPLSRKSSPKQFHKLTSPVKTLLEETYDRVKSIVPEEQIYISTTVAYQSRVLEIFPDMDKDRIIIEPCARNTAPAIALATAYIYAKDPSARIATIASDHAIQNPAEFTEVVQAAFALSIGSPESFVTVGINPTFPSTEFGYIKMGKEVEGKTQKRTFFVDSFKEKPDKKTAEEYLRGWEYLWNASYFIFSASFFLEKVREFTPHITEALEKIDTFWSTGVTHNKDIEEIYCKLPEEPIDTAIVEKLSSTQRLVIPSELQWNDVGNWSALFEFFQNDSDTDMVVKGNHIDVESTDCLIHANERLVATLGLKHVVIVDTQDALLVADKKRVHEVKKLIDKLKNEGKTTYL